MNGERPAFPVASSVLVSACLALLAFGTWIGGQPSTQFWGDDWAGYLMQARALVDGTVDAEVAVNTIAMQGSDVQIGPNAYPWGYPALLAIAGLLSGWSDPGLQAVGGAAAVLLIVSAFALASIQVGLGLSAFVAIAVGMQPFVISDANHIGSDVPFVAVSTLCLVFIFRQLARAQSGRAWSWPLAIAVALTSAIAFTIRSNGAVLPCTYAAMLGLSALHGDRPWRSTILHGFGFAALMGILVGAYFTTLPDGSLSHAGYLSGDPAVWMKRSLAHLHAVANWVTFKRILGPLKLIPLAFLMALLAWGVWRRPRLSVILVVYLALHLVLLTVFPFDGGERYYYPLLPAAFLLVAFGCEGAGALLRQHVNWPGALGSERIAAPTLLAAMAMLMVYHSRIEQARYANAGIEAPYAPATIAAMNFVRDTAPAAARIAFFRPRAFRLLTGRVAVAINQPQNLERVDWYVFNGGTNDPRTQIREDALRDSAAGFRLAYDSPPYRIYVKERTSAAGESSSSERGLP